MKISGAVLDAIGWDRPYRNSRPLKVVELELDPPGEGELLVEIEAAGLCHSDLSVIDGNRPRPTPMLLGHEAAGRVVEIGPGPTDLTPGQLVVMTFLPRCEQCAGCARGGATPCDVGSKTNGAGTLMNGDVRLHRDGAAVLHHLGVSAFATHAVVDRRSVAPVDDMPSDVAALLGCAVLTGGGAVMNAAKPRPGDTLIVVGLGGVGMAAVLTALSVPDVRVVGVDVKESKREIASTLGAHEVYSPPEALDNLVKGSAVIEAAGNVRAFEAAVGLTGPGGRTVTVGLPHPDARAALSLAALVAEGRSVVGSYLGSGIPSRDIPLFAQMWREGRLPVEKLVSDVIHLDEINDGMDKLANGLAMRQVIDMKG